MALDPFAVAEGAQQGQNIWNQQQNAQYTQQQRAFAMPAQLASLQDQQDQRDAAAWATPHITGQADSGKSPADYYGDLGTTMHTDAAYNALNPNAKAHAQRLIGSAVTSHIQNYYDTGQNAEAWKLANAINRPDLVAPDAVTGQTGDPKVMFPQHNKLYGTNIMLDPNDPQTTIMTDGSRIPTPLAISMMSKMGGKMMPDAENTAAQTPAMQSAMQAKQMEDWAGWNATMSAMPGAVPDGKGGFTLNGQTLNNPFHPPGAVPASVPTYASISEAASNVGSLVHSLASGIGDTAHSVLFGQRSAPPPAVPDVDQARAQEGQLQQQLDQANNELQQAQEQAAPFAGMQGGFADIRMARVKDAQDKVQKLQDALNYHQTQVIPTAVQAQGANIDPDTVIARATPAHVAAIAYAGSDLQHASQALAQSGPHFIDTYIALLTDRIARHQGSPAQLVQMQIALHNYQQVRRPRLQPFANYLGGYD